MSKRKTEKLLDEIKRLADCFGEGEESLANEELRRELMESGVDGDELKARCHLAAKGIAQREVMANRSVPVLLSQAIDATRSATDIPHDPTTARKVMDSWLGSFLAPFRVPKNLEGCRAYRKSGEVSAVEQDDLDRLEEELKRKVKEESERET